MQYRRLGRDGPEVSAIGLGCNPMSRVQDDPQSLVTLARAVELGITFFDTAESYGEDCHNEKLLGEGLKAYRDKVFIATKFGLYRGGRGLDGSPANAVAVCEASLRHLQADVIDLYYLHRVDPKVPVEESIGAMAGLVAAGKVRHLGVSACTADELRRAHATHPIVALQSEYSLFERGVEGDVLDACGERGVALVPYAPFWRGVLAGTYWGRHLSQGTPEELAEKDRAFLAPLRALAEARGATAAQVSIAWLLAKGDNIIPIPGTRRVPYLEENVGAVDLALSADEVAALDGAFPPGIDEKIIAARGA